MRNILLILLAAVQLQAATLYVRDGASGTGDGSDWTNAYDELKDAEANASRGDIIYVADGVYTNLTFDVPESGTSIISVKKAITSDHGTETGWSSTYGDGQAVIYAIVVFSTGYWEFDGQVGGGPSSWTSGHGFKIQTTDDITENHAIGMSIQPSATNSITIAHLEIQGNGDDGLAPAYKNDLFKVGAGNFDLTVSHCYLHSAGLTLMSSTDGDGVTVQYTYFGEFESTDEEHAEAIALGNQGDADNWTFRWCLFTHAEGTGGIIASCDGLEVYGCVFYRGPGSVWSGNGAIGVWSSQAQTNTKIYNNSFVLSSGSGDWNANDSVEFRNNLYYLVTFPFTVTGGSPVDREYQHYIETTGNYTPEATATTATGDPFTDYTNLDFTLTANTTSGVDLGAPYNVDMYGTTRTTWTRGALEYGSVIQTSGQANNASVSGSIRF